MNRVSMLRKEAGLSQKELAARLGVQPSVVSKYENGGIQLQEDTLRQLSIIFGGVSVDFILGLSDDRKRGTSRSSPQIVWDAVALVEGANTLTEENRALLLDCIKDPEVLALAGRFQRLSKKSKRRVVEYMDMLKLADEAAKAERPQEPRPTEE
ncbi:MAG: helix-turn-helix transcriptional regulator [Oscillibacter sp.]|nr:helix-turn-helix transcriptional regulator [Oscillibacter sp.]